MRAGTLRHRITLQQRVEVQDQITGAISHEWQDYRTVWASVEPLSVRELLQSNQIHAGTTARIVIRYLMGIEPTMRIIYNSKQYNIDGILPDKRSGREYLTIAVSEGSNDG